VFNIHIHALLQHYGTTGVFAMLFLEAIGIPFPAETTLVTAGVTLAIGMGHTLVLIFFAALGNIAGSTIAYGIGRFLGRPILLRFGKFIGITEIRLNKVEDQFNRSSTLFLVIGKFIAFVRIIVPYLAGINKIPFVRFSLLNGVSAIVWSALFITIGRSVEGVWHRYKNFFEHHLIITGLIVLIVVFLVIFIKWVEGRRHRK
jgi:membrane protein DedA with SNARE-associated domain